MVLAQADSTDEKSSDQTGVIPPEVEFLISALEVAPRPLVERQQLKRTRYRVAASMRLFSDPLDEPRAVVYTRHVNEKAVGFVTQTPLALSHGGVIEMQMPDGRTESIGCTVIRCRQAAPGWYEGAVYFNRPQPDLAASALREP
jgi:hypothetical protein